MVGRARHQVAHHDLVILHQSTDFEMCAIGEGLAYIDHRCRWNIRRPSDRDTALSSLGDRSQRKDRFDRRSLGAKRKGATLSRGIARGIDRRHHILVDRARHQIAQHHLMLARELTLLNRLDERGIGLWPIADLAGGRLIRRPGDHPFQLGRRNQHWPGQNDRGGNIGFGLGGHRQI